MQILFFIFHYFFENCEILQSHPDISKILAIEFCSSRLINETSFQHRYDSSSNSNTQPLYPSKVSDIHGAEMVLQMILPKNI
jgi:hypothetical protein